MYFNVTPGGPTCTECFDEMFPPSVEGKKPLLTMKLAELSTGIEKNTLYNSTLKKYETLVGLTDLKRCGWFLRKKKIRKDLKYYTLEFVGNVKCARFPNFEFPESFSQCLDSERCLAQMVRRLKTVTKFDIYSSRAKVASQTSL